MKKLYEKNELTFALVWIVIYCVLQSLANPLNEMIGIEYSASAAFCILQAVVLFAFIRKNNLLKRYGLCKPLCPCLPVPLLCAACWFWHREISGTVLPSITHQRKRSAVSYVCSALDFWRK